MIPKAHQRVQPIILGMDLFCGRLYTGSTREI
jgi:hypothetical protein